MDTPITSSGISLMFTYWCLINVFWTTGSGNYERKNWFGFWSHQGSLYKVSKNPKKSFCLNFFSSQNNLEYFPDTVHFFWLGQLLICQESTLVRWQIMMLVMMKMIMIVIKLVMMKLINSCVMAFGLYCSISLPLQIPFLLKILFLQYCLVPFPFLLCSLVLWTLPEDQKDIRLPRLLFMVSAMMIVPKTLASMVLVKNST